MEQRMCESVISLSLEIIHLLTGEDYVVVKTCGVQDILRRTQSHSSPHPASAMPPQRSTQHRILQVLSKMAELLTGEVPIRCDDVAIYLSMEEQEYLEGHRNLYKAAMMEDLISRTPAAELDTQDFGGRMDTDILAMVKLVQEPNGLPLLQQESCDEGESLCAGHCVPANQGGMVSMASPLVQIKEEPCIYEQESIYGAPLNTHNTLYTSSHLKEKPSLHEEGCPCLGKNGNKDVSDITNLTSTDENSSRENVCTVQQNVHSLEIYNCPDCSESFSSNLELVRHQALEFCTAESFAEYKKTHNRIMLPCPECGKGFPSKQRLNVHRKWHSNIRPFKCPECGVAFKKKHHMQRHQAIHALEHLWCTQCQLSFRSEAELTAHKKVHASPRVLAPRQPETLVAVGHLFPVLNVQNISGIQLTYN